MSPSKDLQHPDDDRHGAEKIEIALRDQDVQAVAEERVGLRIDPYVRRRWTESKLPRTPLDIQAGTAPITLVDAALDSAVFSVGERATGPFERVLLREEDL